MPCVPSRGRKEGRLRLPEGEGPDRERESEPYECPAAVAAAAPAAAASAAASRRPPVEPLGLPRGVRVEVLVQDQVVLGAANRFDLRI